MKRTQHGQYTTQLTRFPHIFPVSAYLVREDDGFTLVDTTIPGSGGAIAAIARNLGAPIVRIVLTHAHMDHVGSADALHAALPGAELLASARDARFLAGERTLDADETNGKLRGAYSTIQTRPSRLLEDGDRVGSLLVVSSPGHTPGHISVFDQRDGTLIAGDAFQIAGGIAVSGTVRPLFPFPAMATWYKLAALETARRLVALNPSRLAVGHGRVLESPVSAMNEAIRVAAGKLKAEASSVA
jgi:glyoxylase-like metal-dependent hydrolase (beta-lactamase superfamily II)